MEIHDLNTKTLTDPAYIAFDDGTDTYKAEFNDAVEEKAAAAVAATDLTQNQVAFTSGDAASPTAWSNVSVITTGSTLATLFNRISTMVKNVRYIWSLMGTTSISGIGNGTITGAINTLNGKTTWDSDSGYASLSAFTSHIDSVIGNGSGFLFGYLTATSAGNVNLTATGHYYQAYSNSSNYRIVMAIPTTGNHIYTLTKTNGTWASSWNTLV